MIVVIADDLTGAAEIAGIGFRYGLSSAIIMPFAEFMGFDTDLVVMCTDTRSLSRKKAMAFTKSMMPALSEGWEGLNYIYKKTDSVFRGHVLEELKIEMAALGLEKALIVAANPGLGRTIRDGVYYIHGQPIHTTGFAADPEFAITDSSVLRMTGAVAGEAQVLKNTDKLPARGIIIGEAGSEKDISAWAESTDSGTYLAGAGDFFTALLNKELKPVTHIEIEPALPHLYVSGTAFDKSVAMVKNIKERSGCVVYLSETMIRTGSVNDEGWLNKVIDTLIKNDKCVIAIEERVTAVPPLQVRNVMAKAVNKIFEEAKVKELFIEGGATAGAILQEMFIDRLDVISELQRGVVKMETGDLYITMKPGSYELPEQIKNLYLAN